MANFSERTMVFKENSNSSIQLKLHNCLTTKKLVTDVQKHANTSTSPYTNFPTASVILV